MLTAVLTLGPDSRCALSYHVALLLMTDFQSLIPGTQAGLRQLEEGACPMRQAFAARGQAVLLVGRHLAEGAGVAVGQEHRVVAEAQRPARRPDQRAVDAGVELLDVLVGPGDAKRGDEMRGALLGAVCAAFAQKL